MIKQRLALCFITIVSLLTSSSVWAQRPIQETRQEIRQEARIENRTEARIERRRSGNSNTSVVIINNAMLRTVSYKGVVLLHDPINHRFYRAINNGYQAYNVPYGAKVIELAPASPTQLTILQ